MECPWLSYNVLFDVRWAWEIAHSLHATDQLTQEKSLSSEVAESSEVTSLEEEVRRLRQERASRRAQNAGLQGQLAERDNAASLLLSCLSVCSRTVCVRVCVCAGVHPCVRSSDVQTILHANYSLQFHVRRLSHFDIAVERLNEWREWLNFLITQQSIRQCRGAVMRATTKLSPWTSLRHLRSLLNGKVEHEKEITSNVGCLISVGVHHCTSDMLVGGSSPAGFDWCVFLSSWLSFIAALSVPAKNQHGRSVVWISFVKWARDWRPCP